MRGDLLHAIALSAAELADEVDLGQVSETVAGLEAADGLLGGADIVGIQHGHAGPAVFQGLQSLIHDVLTDSGIHLTVQLLPHVIHLVGGVHIGTGAGVGKQTHEAAGVVQHTIAHESNVIGIGGMEVGLEVGGGLHGIDLGVKTRSVQLALVFLMHIHRR